MPPTMATASASPAAVVEDFDPFGLQEEPETEVPKTIKTTRKKEISSDDQQQQQGEEVAAGPVLVVTHSLRNPNKDHSSPSSPAAPTAAADATNKSNNSDNRSFDPFGLVVDSQSSPGSTAAAAQPLLVPATEAAAAAAVSSAPGGAEEKKDDDDNDKNNNNKVKDEKTWMKKSVQEKITFMQRKQRQEKSPRSTKTNTFSTSASKTIGSEAAKATKEKPGDKETTADDDAPDDEAINLSPPEVNRITRQQPSSSTTQPPPTTTAGGASSSVDGMTTATGVATTATGTSAKSGSSLLPPKVMVKLSVHEEASSVARKTADGNDDDNSEEGSSDVQIEGFVYVQVQCSDAKKNAPFMVRPVLIDTSDGGGGEEQPILSADGSINNEFKQKFTIRPDNGCSSNASIHHNHNIMMMARNKGSFSKSLNDGILVTIPKKEIGFVSVAQYTYSETVTHMPLLLERKVTYNETNRTCRIAIQVRSKLTNNGPLEDFTVAVSIPNHIDGDSITIIRGEENGIYDEVKRLVKWKLPSLNKGESFMVCAQGKFWDDKKQPQDGFPVLLRASAPSDRISIENGLDFHSYQLDGYPASVTTVTKTNTFRLLHRLA